MRRANLWRALAQLPLVGLASCSFLTASGFSECATDEQCGESGVCSEKYCLTLPDRCQRAEGAFSSPNRIPLVALMPLTQALDGGAPDEKEAMRLNAMRMAVAEVNGSDGVKNRLFALYSCDTGRNDEEIKQLASWFVTQLRVPALLTSGSSQTKATAAESARTDAGTLVVSPSATSPELIDVYKADPSVWRVAPPDTLQAKVLASLIDTEAPYNTPASTRVSLVYEETSYGRGLQDKLNRALASDGGHEVYSRSYAATSPLEAGVIEKVLDDVVARSPGTTVLIGQPSASRELIAAAKSRPTLARAQGHRWLFTDSAKSPALVDAVTLPEVAGLLGTAPAQGKGVDFNVFRDSFQARFRLDPSNYSYTSQSYDAAYLVMLASAWAVGREALWGPGLAQGMASLSSAGGKSVRIGPASWREAADTLHSGIAVDVEGTSGPLNFDLTTGAPSAPYEIWRVEADGGISTVGLVTPEP